MLFDGRHAGAVTTGGFSKELLTATLLYGIQLSREPMDRLDDYVNRLLRGSSGHRFQDYVEAIDWVLGQDLQAMLFTEDYCSVDKVRPFLEKLREVLLQEIGNDRNDGGPSCPVQR
ncbi:MAG: hypothetical protein HY815_34155 [Candidatus Riflebacteria bacterium]|nr:hypothetical protein [Candidatus Riflebacteria bacterium]